MATETQMHKTLMAGDKDRWTQFIRNGRWGTCVDCPRDADGNVYPEMCEHTDRSDHHLTLDDLVEQYKHFMKRKDQF